MNAWRRFVKSDAMRGLACRFVANYMALVHATTRWTIEGRAAADARWDANEPFILAFWHGRIGMMPYSWRRDRPMNMLISKHRDGELIANTIARLGIKSIRGSAAKAGSDKNKGGQEALMALVRAIRAGESIGITPDGPRGPRMRASVGVAAVARLTGVPVIPCAYATRARRVLFDSWDHFVAPLPFTRGAFVWGEPIFVDRKADAAALEDARARIEAALIAVTQRADEIVGQTPIQPAPAEPTPEIMESHA